MGERTHGAQGVRHRSLVRMAVLSAIVLLVLGGVASSAGAHPLGNITVNRYARVEVSAGVVRVLLRARQRRDTGVPGAAGGRGRPGRAT